MEIYKSYLDVDIKNNKPVNVPSGSSTFLQINRIVDCLREKGDLRSYSKNDKCLALLYLTDGNKDIMILVLDSDHIIMNLDPGSKILATLQDLKPIKGVYPCFKSHLTLLGGTVEDLKQANDIAKETYALRNISMYNKKSTDDYPKFIPFQPRGSNKPAATHIPPSTEKVQASLSKMSIKSSSSRKGPSKKSTTTRQR